MNILETYIAKNGLVSIDTMNRLTEAGIISDNAILPADVCETDALRATWWLENKSNERT